MAQLCASSSPPIDNPYGNEMVKGKLKRSPRCMQIDLLPLIATNIITTRAHRPNKPTTNISPVVWDEQLHLWIRYGTLSTSIKPSIQNSNSGHSLEEHLQPPIQSLSSHAEKLTPPGSNNNDKDPNNDTHLLTMSTSLEIFSPINIANAFGRAWLSSMLDAPNRQGKDEIAGCVRGIERENLPEEISQLPVGVESICTNLNVWDLTKHEGNDPPKPSIHRSYILNPGLNECQQCTATLAMERDENEECTRIHEDYFVEPQVNKPLKLCPTFLSPWFDQKTYPFSDSQEMLNSSPNGSLDWTRDVTTDTHDTHGFDGVGLRRPRESDSNRVRSHQSWNGKNPDGRGRNVRQRVQMDQNIIDNDFLDNYDGFEPGENLTRWYPQPGDILVTRRPRHGDHLSPGGHVTLYKDAEFFFYAGDARVFRVFQHDFQDGDFVVRLGKFTQDWKWHPTPRIEAFLFDLSQVRPWWLVARTYNQELQPPVYPFDSQFRAPVNTVDRTFCPRLGDLVVRAVPGEYNWGLYWWNHYFNFSPCDLVLRAGFEVRANGTCMVVELYYREQDDRDWSFRGRDVWTYLCMPGLGPQPMQDPGPPIGAQQSLLVD